MYFAIYTMILQGEYYIPILQASLLSLKVIKIVNEGTETS